MLFQDTIKLLPPKQAEELEYPEEDLDLSTKQFIQDKPRISYKYEGEILKLKDKDRITRSTSMPNTYRTLSHQYFIQGSIKEVDKQLSLKILIDTRSSDNFIFKSLVNRIYLRHLTSPIEFQKFNGHIDKCFQYIDAHLYLKDSNHETHEYEHRLLIRENMCNEVILGLEFLKKYDYKIDAYYLELNGNRYAKI